MINISKIISKLDSVIIIGLLLFFMIRGCVKENQVEDLKDEKYRQEIADLKKMYDHKIDSIYDALKDSIDYVDNTDTITSFIEFTDYLDHRNR